MKIAETFEGARFRVDPEAGCPSWIESASAATLRALVVAGCMAFWGGVAALVALF